MGSCYNLKKGPVERFCLPILFMGVGGNGFVFDSCAGQQEVEGFVDILTSVGRSKSLDSGGQTVFYPCDILLKCRKCHIFCLEKLNVQISGNVVYQCDIRLKPSFACTENFPLSCE